MINPVEPVAGQVNGAVGAQLGWLLSEAEVVDQFVGRSGGSIGELIAAPTFDAEEIPW
ncbi:hypothetical protein ACL02O_30915 [Micromonospora sp. MS34]|uniref:hypothetical protein n=1 Tax=Micromonospora sp. MS34 TaxID=3385971 RepID=UPI0039A25E95